MKYFAAIAAVLAVSLASPAPYGGVVIEDESGAAFYLVPVARQKRDFDWNVQDGKTLTLQESRKLYENDNSRVDGTAFGQKNFADRLPGVVGGKIDWTNTNTGSGVSVSAQHQQHGPTDVAAQAKWNLYQKGGAGLDLTGDYKQQFGGPKFPGGPQNPDYGVFLRGHIDY